MCCTDFTKNLIEQEPFAEKWRAFGWDTAEVNGHSVEELLGILANVRERGRDRPFCIIANTIKGNGLDFASNAPLWHGMAPSGNDIERAYNELDGRYAI
jgi:transketolase